MRTYEKKLLNRLQSDFSPVETPLKNVRESLGYLSHTVGNPLSKTEISITVITSFVQVGVGVILPAALPVGLQTALPFYLFGLTDFYGSYIASQRIVSPIPVWNFNGAAIALAVGAAGQVPGDMVINFNAVVGINNFNAFVIIHCNNVAYGTFLNSFVSDLITIDLLRYIVPIANINQFINPLFFGTQSLFGKVKADSIDPRMYITNVDPQQQIADIPLNLPVDKTLMICSYIDVFCQFLSFVLFVEKVEPLTHKLKLR